MTVKTKEEIKYFLTFITLCSCCHIIWLFSDCPECIFMSFLFCCFFCLFSYPVIYSADQYVMFVLYKLINEYNNFSADG